VKLPPEGAPRSARPYVNDLPAGPWVVAFEQGEQLEPRVGDAYGVTAAAPRPTGPSLGVASVDTRARCRLWP